MVEKQRLRGEGAEESSGIDSNGRERRQQRGACGEAAVRSPPRDAAAETLQWAQEKRCNRFKHDVV